MQNRNCQMLVLCGLFLGTVVFHTQVRQAVISTGTRCLTVIVPSLYLFSILAVGCVKSGFLEWLVRPFQKFCKADLSLWGIVLFSQIGGYPIGGQLLHTLYQEQKISRQQEQDLLCVCMGCGFGFLFAVVGGSTRTALLLLACMVLPNLLLAMWILRNCPKGSESEQKEPLSVSCLITESVSSGAESMLKICSMILAFGAFMGILQGIAGTLSPLVRSILEISNLTDYLQNGGHLPEAVALLSFGGICVQLQISAVTENHLAWVKFLLCRVVVSGLSYGLCRLMFFCIPAEKIPVFLTEYQYSVSRFPDLLPVCCLMLMSVLVLKKYHFFYKILTNSKK